MGYGLTWRRLAVAAVVVAAELAAVAGLTVATRVPANAQFFDDRFPYIEERRRRGIAPPSGFNVPGIGSIPGLFGEQRSAPAPTVDSSRAPPPKKHDTAPQTNVVVLGDAMADWLAYGLETAAAESPDIGILRRHKTLSGLIRVEVKNDPRGDYPDWPQAAKDILAADRPEFVVMMIGLNDRRPIRERAPARTPAGQAAHQPAKPPADAEAPSEPPAAGDNPAIMVEPEVPAGPGTMSHEFRSEKWAELYITRIDETIAALKARNVPVFWVGLPPIRGARGAADVSYLNDLYRSRAEKAGITYIDTWDGFVDDAGRFVTQGPDFEGQIRRLRAGDGVYFTQAGARKLAHFVEREIQRALMTRATPVALPIPDEPAQPAPAVATPSARPGPIARPLAGPAVPLISGEGDGDDVLAGGANSRNRGPAPDPASIKVLVRGEPISAPAGRADDFAWPRRDVAPLGADPIVATTTTPPRPFERRQVASQGKPDAAAAGDTAAQGRKPAPRPTAVASREQQQRQQQQQPQPQRPQQSFFGLFGQPQPPPQPNQQQAQRRIQQQPPQFYFPFFSR